MKTIEQELAPMSEITDAFRIFAIRMTRPDAKFHQCTTNAFFLTLLVLAIQIIQVTRILFQQ